jgi:hypothetical protein
MVAPKLKVIAGKRPKKRAKKPPPVGTPRHMRVRRPIEITLSDEAMAKLWRLAHARGFFGRGDGNRSRVVERLVMLAEEAPRRRRISAGPHPELAKGQEA